MVAPKTTSERTEATREEERCCPALRKGKALGLTLLTAAIVVPVVCHYLSKRLWAKGKASLAKLRPGPQEPPPPQRITIPVTVVAPPPESDVEAPTEAEAEAVVTLPETPAAAVEVVAGKTEAAPFVGSTESDKFHVAGCRWARNIDTDHRISFPSREAAIDQGYVACGTCKP